MDTLREHVNWWRQSALTALVGPLLYTESEALRLSKASEVTAVKSLYGETQ